MSQQNLSKKYVIFDCDGGSDDAWALLLLLRAEQCGLLELLAVTTTGCGNTTCQHAVRNMRRILSACSRKDVPIYIGAAEPLVGHVDGERMMFHGRDGFGDCLADDHCEEMSSYVQPQHAVTAIYSLCKERPQQITIIAVGPLTNLALGYTMYGEQFGQLINDIFIMGGNYQGVGNITRAAEFNFHSDPEAAHAVLLKARCPITILPWETCTKERFFIPLTWRLEEFGKSPAACKHIAIDILNQVENAQFKCDPWNPCDAILVAAWLFDEPFVKKSSNWHATVDLTGTHTRGQMVLDHLRECDKFPENVRIIEWVDDEAFKKIIEWAVGMRDGVELKQIVESKVKDE